MKNCILNICCSLVDELKGFFFLAGKIVLNQSVSLGISVKKRECMVIEFRNSFLLTACVYLYTFTVYLCNRVMLLVSPTCWHVGESNAHEAWQCLTDDLPSLWLMGAFAAVAPAILLKSSVRKVVYAVSFRNVSHKSFEASYGILPSSFHLIK